MTIFNRAKLLALTLRRLAKYPSSKEVELVIVDDQSTDEIASVLKVEGLAAFSRVLHIRMDKKRSIIPVVHNNPALGINIAVRHATAPIILKTDPECYPLCDAVGCASRLFDERRLVFANIHRGNQHLNERLLGLPREAELPPSEASVEGSFRGTGVWECKDFIHHAKARHAYWFSAIFSRDLFFKIGGLDEKFLQGFAGEDDEWAERMTRNGATHTWVPDFTMIHLWHAPPQNAGNFQKAWHERNKNLLWESRQLKTMVANQGHDWGSDKAVTDVQEYAHQPA